MDAFMNYVNFWNDTAAVRWLYETQNDLKIKNIHQMLFHFDKRDCYIRLQQSKW